jgi:hypothetical protein
LGVLGKGKESDANGKQVDRVVDCGAG